MLELDVEPLDLSLRLGQLLLVYSMRVGLRTALLAKR